MVTLNGKELPCSYWINKHTSSDGTADDMLMTCILAYSMLLFLRSHGSKDRQTNKQKRQLLEMENLLRRETKNKESSFLSRSKANNLGYQISY